MRAQITCYMVTEIYYTFCELLFSVGAGVVILSPNFQKVGKAWQDLNFYSGVAGKKGVTFSRSCNFYIKDKLKSEIFNDQQKCFALSYLRI